ncbi:MAG: D-alanyl-D-alanine carboxypeptidase family protein [Desulfobacteraceae bacterium]|jgi:D-alanyl-D-alanine carboxypeptidase (penicillin-binding protein 5/6)
MRHIVGKIGILAMIWWTLVFSIGLPQFICAQQHSCPFNASSVSAVLMDADNGQIVYSQNPHHRMQPASLAKVMTLFLIFDALERGDVRLTDEVMISKKAVQKKGSTMYLREKDKVPLVELIKGIAIVSGNDACVAAAEAIYGSEQDFVDKMNQKLRDLSLQDSKFQTVDGWPVPEQYTTAYDTLMLSQAYIREHPEALEYHKLREFSHADIVLHNRNELILQDPSVDGLKTGHVEEAGFHLVATAERENRRYIAVIMGAAKTETRDKEAMQLLDFGFNAFMTVRLFNKDDILTHLPVNNGVKGEVGLRPTEDGMIKIPSSFREFISYEIASPAQAEAPIELNQNLGQVKISYRKEIIKMIPLLASENIQRADTKPPKIEIEPVPSPSAVPIYMLLVIFILICALVIQYLHIRRLRSELKETDTGDTELVKQRLDRILKSNRDR